MPPALPFRVLVVEDDAAMRALLQSVLDESNRFHVVGEAENGLVGIAETQRLQPDLVVLDLMMPVMNGRQALGPIRKACPDARVAVLSMLPQNPIASEVLAGGASAFLDKGLGDAALVHRLREVMERLVEVAPVPTPSTA